jgi:hypothetical protein
MPVQGSFYAPTAGAFLLSKIYCVLYCLTQQTVRVYKNEILSKKT